MPQIVGGKQIYLNAPDYLQEYAHMFVEAGASIVGGCCGTTTQHIRAMAKVVTGQLPRRKRAQVAVAQIEPLSLPTAQQQMRAVLQEKLGRDFTMTVEIDS